MPPYGQSGSVLLEFALVLPIIFMLLVGSIEFSRGLRAREMMAALGREASSHAFRECAAETQARICTNTLSTADACLMRIRSHVLGLGRITLGDTQTLRITMSTYAYNPNTSSVVALGISRAADGTPDPTEFSEARLQRDFLPLIQSHKVLAIAEVWYGFTPFFNVSWLRPSTFYDPTIY